MPGNSQIETELRRSQRRRVERGIEAVDVDQHVALGLIEPGQERAYLARERVGAQLGRWIDGDAIVNARQQSAPER